MHKRASLIPAFTRTETLLLLTVLIATFFRVYRLNDYPPALYWDEAFDGFDALRPLQSFSFPVFFNGDLGREPIAIYFQTISLLLYGVRDWSLRLAPALTGALTIPVLFRCSTALYADDERAKIIALLSVGMLAVSFWHVHLSRLAIRAVSAPLFSTITVWQYWCALRTHRLRDYVLSGAFLGLTLYTYLPARLLPLVFISFVFVVSLLSLRKNSPYASIHPPREFLGLGAMLATALLVFAPLGIYFLQHPGTFFLRASYVSIFSGDAQGLATLPYNLIAVFRAFIDRGDMEALRNLPGLPGLNPLAAIGFGIGLIIAIVRFASRPVYVMLILWFSFNLVTNLFSVDIPHFYRMSGALPPILILASDGLVKIWDRLAVRANIILLPLFALVLGGVLTFDQYFNVWGPSRQTYVAFDAARQAVLKRAITLENETNVVLPFSLYGTPNGRFALVSHPSPQPLDETRDTFPAAWIFMGGIERNVIILQKDGTIVVPQPLDDTQLARLGRLMKSSQPLRDSFGEPVATELWTNDASDLLTPLKPTHRVGANFGERVKLLGFDVDPSRPMPGDKIRVTYYWQALADGENDYMIISTLLDPFSNAYGKRISEPVSGMSPTSLWRRGAVTVDSFEFKVPENAHLGNYRFEVGITSPDAPDNPLPLSESEDRVLLDPITVVGKEPTTAAIQNPTSIQLGDPPFMTLLGYDLPHLPPRLGEKLLVSLYWKSERPAPLDYSIFLHLLDSDGKILAQQDGPPQNGNAPTSWWQTGDVVADLHELQIPSTIRPGRYVLEIGVYDPMHGPRLSMKDASGNKLGDSFQLQVEVARP